MQYLYSYLHFFSAIVFLGLGIILLAKDFTARLNQTCAGIMFCFFIWSFSTVWVHHPATSETVARRFANVAAIGWLFFNTFHLWFAWLYTKRKPLRSMKVLYAIFFIPPALLLVLQWTRSLLIADFQLRSYGWFTPWEPTFGPPLYFIYLVSTALTSFWLFFDYGRKSDNIFIRRQSVILIVAGFLSLLSGSLTNIIFSLIIPEGFPSIGDITSLIWAAGLSYSLFRYNMFDITPFIAANRIIDTMKDLLFLLDTKGHIISVNNAALETLGCTTHQITGSHFGELIYNKNDRRTAICEAILNTSVYNNEVEVSWAPGPAIPVELSTSLIPSTGIVCVAHDITLQRQRTETLQEAKKQLETKVSQSTEELRRINSKLVKEVQDKNQAVDALQESEERFRIIFEFAPDGIFLIDGDGNVIDGNNEALRISGYSKGDMAGRNLFASGLLSREDSSQIADMITEEPGNLSTEYHEFTLTKKDGSGIPVETSSHQLKIGEKSLSVCIIRDLSQRKKVEKETEELRDALHHSQKMDAIGRLAGGIAHDFNNLLGGIIGYAGLLQKRLHSQFPAESGILGKIIDVSKQAANRTGQLLAFARKGKYNVEPVAIHGVIDEVINLMRHTVNPKITINCRLEAPYAIVNGDRSQLYSTLLNLGVNARDALPEGGFIEFSTENMYGHQVPFKEPQIERHAERFLKIVVKDNGTGMAKETASRVFEPFFSTKAAGEGTGLGLPSVYGTVIQHGGYINCESELHKGTEFIIYLPTVTTAVLPSEEKNTSPAATEFEHEAIVCVVDDTPLMREMMVETLIDIGYTVHSFEEGKKALSWYKEHHATCDLVLLDFTLPDLNGRECFSAMKNIHPSIKAIITSGHAVDGEIKNTLASGAHAFLQKPFEVNDLITLVQEVLSR